MLRYKDIHITAVGDGFVVARYVVDGHSRHLVYWNNDNAQWLSSCAKPMSYALANTLQHKLADAELQELYTYDSVAYLRSVNPILGLRLVLKKLISKHKLAGYSARCFRYKLSKCRLKIAKALCEH
jgi:hypothetical protein